MHTGTVTEYCTEESCPKMSGGSKYVIIRNYYLDDFIIKKT